MEEETQTRTPRECRHRVWAKSSALMKRFITRSHPAGQEHQQRRTASERYRGKRNSKRTRKKNANGRAKSAVGRTRTRSPGSRTRRRRQLDQEALHTSAHRQRFIQFRVARARRHLERRWEKVDESLSLVSEMLFDTIEISSWRAFIGLLTFSAAETAKICKAKKIIQHV